jgi:hypothetical protein
LRASRSRKNSVKARTAERALRRAETLPSRPDCDHLRAFYAHQVMPQSSWVYSVTTLDGVSPWLAGDGRCRPGYRRGVGDSSVTSAAATER